MPEFEFDPAKSRRNEKRHGVSLAWACRLWDQTHVIVAAADVVGESRYLILAEVGGGCCAAIFTRRGRMTRLISCHRADRRLERIYESVRSQEKEQAD